MHIFWFLWENIHIVFFFLLPYSLVQCKRKKKFSGDSRVQLVDTKTPKNPTSKKDARRPQSQVAPQQTPVEMSKVTDDTLANVASIAPDVSTGAPPKP
ncbi:unnamed protein product [Caenorhabditis nigoni]